MNSAKVVDAFQWAAALMVAVGTALAGQDFGTTHGRVIAASAVLGAVAVGLKHPPVSLHD